jgi:glycosyltransferase involved in cell wall biosynthesis
MNELSTRFAEAGGCDFVSWDEAAGGYLVVDLKGPSITGARSTGTSSNASGLESIVQKIRHRSKLINKALVIPAKVARKAMRPEPVPVATDLFSLQSSDTLFILADWHGSQKFVDYVIAQKRAGVRLMQICYDLLPIVTPQYSGHATESLTRYTKTIYPLCGLLFSISEHTKRDIDTWLKSNRLRVPPISVMRLGDDFELAKPEKPTDKHFVAAKAENFILCVGTVEARKNHTLLYYVYKFAKQKKIDLPKLVIVGRRGWKTDDAFEIMNTDPDTKDQFIFMQNTGDEQLAWLYTHAAFTIYPSFYEGWGLPIAESIAYDAPCIASNTSSMPEIAGDLIEYFNPLSTDECLAAIQAMLKPGAIDKAKAKLKAYKPTSWDQTFEFVNKEVRGR